MCEAWKLWMVGNSACPGTGGLLQWAFWAPKAWYSGLTLCPRTWTAAHFACWSSIHNHIWMHRPNALYILLLKGKLPYLKFSKVSSCVISLNSSSLKEANTFRSFTRISKALALSCLWHRQQIQQKKQPWQQQGTKSSVVMSRSPIKGLRYFCLQISKIFME